MKNISMNCVTFFGDVLQSILTSAILEFLIHAYSFDTIVICTWQYVSSPWYISFN